MFPLSSATPTPFNLALTKGANTINITVQDMFILAPQDFSGIDSVVLSSLSATPDYFTVRIYGQ